MIGEDFLEFSNSQARSGILEDSSGSLAHEKCSAVRYATVTRALVVTDGEKIRSAVNMLISPAPAGGFSILTIYSHDGCIYIHSVLWHTSGTNMNLVVGT